MLIKWALTALGLLCTLYKDLISSLPHKYIYIYIYIYIYKEHINLHNFWIFTIELETVVAKDNNGLYYARLVAASMATVTV